MYALLCENIVGGDAYIDHRNISEAAEDWGKAEPNVIRMCFMVFICVCGCVDANISRHQNGSNSYLR